MVKIQRKQNTSASDVSWSQLYRSEIYSEKTHDEDHIKLTNLIGTEERDMLNKKSNDAKYTYTCYDNGCERTSANTYDACAYKTESVGF